MRRGCEGRNGSYPREGGLKEAEGVSLAFTMGAIGKDRVGGVSNITYLKLLAHLPKNGSQVSIMRKVPIPAATLHHIL